MSNVFSINQDVAAISGKVRKKATACLLFLTRLAAYVSAANEIMRHASLMWVRPGSAPPIANADAGNGEMNDAMGKLMIAARRSRDSLSAFAKDSITFRTVTRCRRLIPTAMFTAIGIKICTFHRVGK